MWTRATLKSRGKTAFTANYWKAVLVAFLLMIFVSGGSSIGTYVSNSVQNDDSSDYSYSYNFDSEDLVPFEDEDGDFNLDISENKALVPVLAVAGGIVALAGIAGLLLQLLVFGPLEVGCRRFYLVNSYSPAELSELGYGFKNSYGNMVGGIFVRNLYLFFWSLLFVIPGIVKSYSYRMVPYILAENPDMKANEAITVSRKMMKGQKWDTFVLDLSFIGWHLLSALTAGILSIFFVNPYEYATDAELYKVLKANYLGQNPAPAYAVESGEQTQTVAVQPEQNIDVQ